jgi:hypothetical protein
LENAVKNPFLHNLNQNIYRLFERITACACIENDELNEQLHTALQNKNFVRVQIENNEGKVETITGWVVELDSLKQTVLFRYQKANSFETIAMNKIKQFTCVK